MQATCEFKAANRRHRRRDEISNNTQQQQSSGIEQDRHKKRCCCACNMRQEFPVQDAAPQSAAREMQSESLRVRNCITHLIVIV